MKATRLFEDIGNSGKEAEVAGQSLLGKIWSIILFFMWLPLAIPIRVMKAQANLCVRVFKAIMPYLARAWCLICDVSPKAAVYAEKVPCIGSYLAWLLNLPPRLNLKEFLYLILSFFKKRDDPIDIVAA